MSLNLEGIRAVLRAIFGTQAEVSLSARKEHIVELAQQIDEMRQTGERLKQLSQPADDLDGALRQITAYRN